MSYHISSHTKTKFVVRMYLVQKVIYLDDLFFKTLLMYGKYGVLIYWQNKDLLCASYIMCIRIHVVLQLYLIKQKKIVTHPYVRWMVMSLEASRVYLYIKFNPTVLSMGTYLFVLTIDTKKRAVICKRLQIEYKLQHFASSFTNTLKT